jgi:sulfatase maturation enzyme AslB (radical SAM superfamily)
MKTPWMQTHYKSIEDSQYLIRYIDDDLLEMIHKAYDTRYLISQNDYKLYINNQLDCLKMENLYLRGFAADDEGNIIPADNIYVGNNIYVPLSEDEYLKFNISTNNKYTVMINPEIGSWVAFENNEYDLYINNCLDGNKMENLYLRGLAKDSDSEFVVMNFPKPAEKPSVIVVNLTMDCNLKCKYCFAACEPGKGESMGNEVMTRVITQMFTMPSKLITFELQGGEPLCYFEGMKTFVEIAESLKDQFNKIVKYRTVTNATMITDEFIEFAKKYDVAVCVSLDGDEEMTNQTRVYADGKGAFSEIIKGVHKLKQDYKIDGAVCTIGQHNMKYAKRIMEFFIDQGISFQPRPANI